MRVKISFHKKEKKHTCKRDPDAILNAQLLIDSLKYLCSVSFYRDHIVIIIIIVIIVIMNPTCTVAFSE